MNRLFPIILILGFLTNFVRDAYSTPVLCGGGGVVPMIDLSPTVTPVKIPDDIQNFALWEKSDQVIYRNSNNRLNSFHLSDGTVDQLASRMKHPVSHVVDPSERLVLTSQLGRLFDTVFSIWRWLLFRPVTMEHLFWNNNILYSVAHDVDNQGQNIFQIYKYDYDGGDHEAQKLCKAIPQDTQLDIKVAKGSAYPFIYLYKIQNTAMGYSMWVSKIDVSTTPCQMSDFTIYPQYLSSPVNDVHWFEDDSFAISLAAPSANLVWQTNNSCQIFSVGDGKVAPMVPNNQVHVLALDQGQGKVSLIYPDQQLQGLVELPTTGATDADNIWLTSDKTRLFAAPAAAGSKRTLYQATIRSVP